MSGEAAGGKLAEPAGLVVAGKRCHRGDHALSVDRCCNGVCTDSGESDMLPWYKEQPRVPVQSAPPKCHTGRYTKLMCEAVLEG